MPISNQKENIDIRILRLIGLEDVFDLDYETYSTLLKEAMIKGRMAKTAIPTEEVMLLTEEYKRIKTKKGRFQVKKKNKIGPTSFSVGSIKTKISTKALPGTAIGMLPVVTSVENNISTITSSFVSILDTLKKQKKQDEKEDEYGRRKSEQEKRALTESKLEKRFEGLKKVAEKVIAPVKSLLDKILEFFTTVILGRIVYKLIEWMGDPKNVSKVKSIIRFVKDWWPALIGGFVLFGTRFGKGVRVLTKIALSAVGKLSKAIPVLLRFAKKNPAAALGIAGGAYAATQLSQRAFSGGSEESKVEGRSGGGYVKFAGGGFNFGFTNIFNGLVSGEKGVDKVPAMLSDGEFVMSRGAVQKYGIDTLEAMNAAGGGTNKPKIVSGTTYAAGGGLIGQYSPKTNTPLYKDPLDAIKRFLHYKFGVDIGQKSTWGIPLSPSSSSKVPTGSLMNDPLGAVLRISKNIGTKVPTFSRSSKSIGKEKNTIQEIMQNLQGPGAATYRDAGSIYAKQMLGGMGGPISELDLGKESRKELQMAIQRAKKRTAFEIRKAELKIKELRAMGAKDGNPALETQKSFLKKLKSGGIRVQYTDYADETGRMSESAKNAKNILGQFWAYGRSQKEGGGYRIEDQYNFDKMKDPRSVLFGKGNSVQQRLQALYQLNPFRGRGDVDMVLGGKRTMPETLGLSSSKTLLGSMLGASGKPQSTNTDEFLRKNPGVKLYDKPQKNTGQPYKSRFARPKNAGIKPVKPPTSKTPKVVYSPGGGGMGGARGSKPSKPQTPNFSATAKGSNSKAKTLGITR